MKRRGISHWIRLGKASLGTNYESARITLTDGRTVTVYDDGTVGIQSSAPKDLPEELHEGWKSE